MQTGAITGYIDIAQVVLYAFWVFFGGLIYYLRSEDKREGYPLQSDRSGEILVQGFPPMPAPKTFILRQGTTYTAPPGNLDFDRPLPALPAASFHGAPLYPTGDPMRDAVGPAAYANRLDEPDLTFENIPKIVPLRVATGFSIATQDPDPRGMEVVGTDGVVAGIVQEVWVDRSEIMMRFFEVALSLPGAARTVLVPTNLTRIDRQRRLVKVKSILGEQFAHVPGIKDPDQITLLEEDRIYAYFAGGHLYAVPQRAEPVL